MKNKKKMFRIVAFVLTAILLCTSANWPIGKAKAEGESTELTPLTFSDFGNADGATVTNSTQVYSANAGVTLKNVEFEGIINLENNVGEREIYFGNGLKGIKFKINNYAIYVSAANVGGTQTESTINELPEGKLFYTDRDVHLKFSLTQSGTNAILKASADGLGEITQTLKDVYLQGSAANKNLCSNIEISFGGENLSEANPIILKGYEANPQMVPLTFSDFGNADGAAVTNSTQVYSANDGVTLKNVEFEGIINLKTASKGTAIYFGDGKNGLKFQINEYAFKVIAGNVGGNSSEENINPGTLVRFTDQDIRLKFSLTKIGTDAELKVIVEGANNEITQTLKDVYLQGSAANKNLCRNIQISFEDKLQGADYYLSNANPLILKGYEANPQMTSLTFSDFGNADGAKVTNSTQVYSANAGVTLKNVEFEGIINYKNVVDDRYMYIGNGENGLRFQFKTYAIYVNAANVGGTTTDKSIGNSTNLKEKDIRIKISLQKNGTNAEMKVAIEGVGEYNDTLKDVYLQGSDANKNLCDDIAISFGGTQLTEENPIILKGYEENPQMTPLTFSDFGNADGAKVTSSTQTYQANDGVTLKNVEFEGIINLNDYLVGSRVMYIGNGEMGLKFQFNQYRIIVLTENVGGSAEELSISQLPTGQNYFTGRDVRLKFSLTKSGTDAILKASADGLGEITQTLKDVYLQGSAANKNLCSNIKISFGETNLSEANFITLKAFKDEMTPLSFGDFAISDGTIVTESKKTYNANSHVTLENIEFDGIIYMTNRGTGRRMIIGNGESGLTFQFNPYTINVYANNMTDQKLLAFGVIGSTGFNTDRDVHLHFTLRKSGNDAVLAVTIDGVSAEQTLTLTDAYKEDSTADTNLSSNLAITFTGATEDNSIKISSYPVAKDADPLYRNLAGSEGYVISGSDKITVNGVLTSQGTLLNQAGDYIIWDKLADAGRERIVLFESGQAHPDEVIDVRDLVALKKAQGNVELETLSGTKGADINRDGIVDVTDFQLMVNHLLGVELITPVKDISLAFEENVMPISGYNGPYIRTVPADDEGRVETIYDYVTGENGTKTFKYLSNVGINLMPTVGANYSNPEEQAEVERILQLGDEYGIGIAIKDSGLNTQGDSVSIAKQMSNYSKYKSFKGIYVADEPVTANYGYKYFTMNAHNTIAAPGTLHPDTGELLQTNIAPRAQKFNSYVNLFSYVNLCPLDQNMVKQENTADYLVYYRDYVDDYVTYCNPKFLSFDYYVFDQFTGSSQYASTKGYFQNLSIMREKSSQHKLPFWSVIQAGSWWNGDGGPLPEKENSVPTQGQMLWNVNTSLAYGAKGITYFPMIQPWKFAYTDDINKNDYERNGLLGANGEPTKWYGYAMKANSQIRAVDEVLMNAISKEVLVQGQKAQTETGISGKTSYTGVLDSITAENGAIVGVFGYQGKTALYVVNYDYDNSQTITLDFAGSKTYTTIFGTVSYNSEVEEVMTKHRGSGTGEQCVLTLDAGAAILVVVEN